MNRQSKLIALIVAMLWIALCILAFSVNPAGAQGVPQINRCQVVMQQIATSHEASEGDTFNNPHPGCVRLDTSNVFIQVKDNQAASVDDVATDAPTVPPVIETTATPEPTDEATAEPTDDPTQAPTANPTNPPTTVPTLAPTQAPTEAPTDEPAPACKNKNSGKDGTPNECNAGIGQEKNQ